MLRYFLIFGLTALFFACTSEATTDANRETSARPKHMMLTGDDGEEFCDCQMLALDKAYNHMYLEDRTKPYTGICRSFYPNGKLKREIQMIDGKNSGYFREYNENGVLIEDGNFKNNFHHGTYRYFDDTGKLTYETEYEMGVSKDYIVSPIEN